MRAPDVLFPIRRFSWILTLCEPHVSEESFDLSADEPIRLDIAHHYHECITPKLGEALAETGAWALKYHGHGTGVSLRVEHEDGTTAFPVTWNVEPDPKSDKTYADHERVAEDAATILALESVRLLTGFAGLERSRKGTRFDYYLTRSDDDTLIFNNATNLEVSGIFAQSKSNTVSARKKTKVDRLKSPGGPGNTGSTYICVVELSTPWAELVLS
jgi:hypothetical protein